MDWSSSPTTVTPMHRGCSVAAAGALGGGGGAGGTEGAGGANWMGAGSASLPRTERTLLTSNIVTRREGS